MYWGGLVIKDRRTNGRLLLLLLLLLSYDGCYNPFSYGIPVAIDNTFYMVHIGTLMTSRLELFRRDVEEITVYIILYPVGDG